MPRLLQERTELLGPSSFEVRAAMAILIIELERRPHIMASLVSVNSFTAPADREWHYGLHGHGSALEPPEPRMTIWVVC
jgi:hypothetical protein